MLSTSEACQLSYAELMKIADPGHRELISKFILEFNKREWSVRIIKKYKLFEDYVRLGYVHDTDFGTGFVINDQAVPYFHPNRSFHDEIIWLNSKLYYDQTVKFNDKIVNSAIVKFYGPSRTLDIITGHASDLSYLKKTKHPYISFELFDQDKDYEHSLMRNIELAAYHKEKLWGTTELRTSLQTAARDHARANPTLIDQLGVELDGQVIMPKLSGARGKMNSSDMIHWIKHLSAKWIKFYETKPTMEQSFNFLTQERGIGNYYGYHFSSNLARMPGVGAKELIESEWKQEFVELQVVDKYLTHGKLDENDDFVMAGPGAMAALKDLFPTLPINSKTSMHIIIKIRDNQEDFFKIRSAEALQHLKEATELGRFTTFGTEISLCQSDVFTRCRVDAKLAQKRAMAPISKEVNIESDVKTCLLEF